MRLYHFHAHEPHVRRTVVRLEHIRLTVPPLGHVMRIPRNRNAFDSARGGFRTQIPRIQFNS
jgi:hypothetical protein